MAIDIQSTLLEFLNQPLDTADGIFEKFSTLPNARTYIGKNPGERFLFIQGSRPDAATLVAHADTVFNVSGKHEIVVNGDIIQSGSPNYGIGADDRAGCAMLWLMKDLGHHLLICDYEESTHHDAHGCCVGSKYLMREHQEISYIINTSSFVLEFDRRLAYGERKESYTSYNLPVSNEFREFIESNTGYIDDDNTGYTDIMELCIYVCGANVCVGYSNAHSSREKISISAFQNTYQRFTELLSKKLERYPLKGKENLDFIPPQAIPYWLKDITDSYHIETNEYLLAQMKSNMKEKMKKTDIRLILKNSLFYSACGNDIEAIINFEKYVHSFIYCIDYNANLDYETVYTSIKSQLRGESYKRRININLNIDFLHNNNWWGDQVWLKQNKDRFKANWGIWQHKNNFLSLIVIYSDSYTLWKNLYNFHQENPKVFYYQSMLNGWKGGMDKKGGGEFLVNSEFICDGINMYRNM